MRITRERLQEMVDEAVADAVVKSETRLVESRLRSGVRNVDFRELLEFAEAYASLDRSARDELLSAARGGRTSIASVPRLVESRLRGLNNELDEFMTEWKTYASGHASD